MILTRKSFNQGNGSNMYKGCKYLNHLFSSQVFFSHNQTRYFIATPYVIDHGGECLLKLLCGNYLTDKGVYVLIKTVFTVKLLKKREGHCKQRPENGNPILPAQFIATKRMR